ncbi:MAG TPA: hypothetical protein GXX64_05990 [Bacteroidales bacterium]|nr:hypothetical protein [Bacteroidales bacterium]
MIEFERIGYRAVTLITDTDLKAATDKIGAAVALTGDSKVGLGNAGDYLFGCVNQFEDDYATIQDYGYCTLGVSPVEKTEEGVTAEVLPVAGDWVTVDGAGKVQLSADVTVTLDDGKAAQDKQDVGVDNEITIIGGNHEAYNGIKIVFVVDDTGAAAATAAYDKDENTITVTLKVAAASAEVAHSDINTAIAALTDPPTNVLWTAIKAQTGTATAEAWGGAEFELAGGASKQVSEVSYDQIATNAQVVSVDDDNVVVRIS